MRTLIKIIKTRWATSARRIDKDEGTEIHSCSNRKETSLWRINTCVMCGVLTLPTLTTPSSASRNSLFCLEGRKVPPVSCLTVNSEMVHSSVGQLYKGGNRNIIYRAGLLADWLTDWLVSPDFVKIENRFCFVFDWDLSVRCAWLRYCLSSLAL